MKKRILSLAMVGVLAASLFAGCGSSSNTAKDSYNIGILQLVQHPALDAATQGFKDALTEKLGDKVSFHEENAAGEAATCATIANTFASENVDLMLGNATAALVACTQASDKIPVLGTSITDYATALSLDNFQGTTGMNASGTCDLAPLDQQADITKELFPEAKTVGIIYCSAEPNSQYQAKVITGYYEKLGLTVKEFPFADSNDIASIVKAACAESDVLYVPTDNTAASCAETIASVVVPAKMPVIAGEEGICAGCGVATLSIDYYDLGYKTGEMAYDILVNGKDVSTYEIQYAPQVTKKYNKSICDQLGVTAPEGYVAIEE